MAKKNYVLDTSVCLTDANVIYKFDNHDIFLPLKVLEEYEEWRRVEDFEKNIAYLSDIMGNTQLDITESNRLLTTFLLENPQFAAQESQSLDIVDGSGIMELINLNKQSSIIEKALVLLRNYFEGKERSLIVFSSGTDFFSVLSRDFIASLQNLRDVESIEKVLLISYEF